MKFQISIIAMIFCANVLGATLDDADATKQLAKVRQMHSVPTILGNPTRYYGNIGHCQSKKSLTWLIRQNLN